MAATAKRTGKDLYGTITYDVVDDNGALLGKIEKRSGEYGYDTWSGYHVTEINGEANEYHGFRYRRLSEAVAVLEDEANTPPPAAAPATEAEMAATKVGKWAMVKDSGEVGRIESVSEYGTFRVRFGDSDETCPFYRDEFYLLEDADLEPVAES